MFQRMMRAYALQSDKKSLFRAVSVLLGVVLGGQHASATLTVDDSLNRYSLYGRKIVDIKGAASTSEGGWIGSDLLVNFEYGDTVRSTVTSGRDFLINNGGNWVWGDVRVARDMGSSTMHHDSVSGKIWVGRNLIVQEVNKFKDSVSLGGTFSTAAYGSPEYFGTNTFIPTSPYIFSSPTPIPGLTWKNDSRSIPWSTWVFPDTTSSSTALTIKTGYFPQTLFDGNGKLRWSCGTNASAGGSDLVALGICKANDTILPPGNYGDVSLWFGSTLYLTEGVYTFNNVNLPPASGTDSSRILAYQPNMARTVLIVKGTLTSSGSGRSNVLAPEAYKQGYYDPVKNPNGFAGGTMMVYVEKPVKLGPSFDLWATMVVPDHSVELFDKVHLFGQILADSIIVNHFFKGADGAFIPYYPKRPVVNFVNPGSFVTYKEKDLVVAGQYLGDKTIGDPDTTWAKIPLSLDHVNGAPVYVYYHTEAVAATATGTTALGTKDFVAVAKGVSVITATNLTDTIRIPVLGDKVYESPESFRVVLDSVKNADVDGEQIKIGQDIAVIVIDDNDPPPGHLHLTAATPTPSVLTRSIKDTVVFTYKLSMTDMADLNPMQAQAGGVNAALIASSPAPGAVFGGDFVTASSTNVSASTTTANLQVTIPQGQSSTTIYVKVPPTTVYSPELKFQYSINCTNVTGSQCGTNDLSVLSTIQGIPVHLDLVGGTATNASTTPPVAMTLSLRSDETNAAVTSTVGINYSWYTKDSTAMAGTHFTGTATKAVPLTGTLAIGASSQALNVSPIVVNSYDATRYFYGMVTPTSVLKSLSTKPDTAVSSLTNGWPKMTIAVSGLTVTRPANDSVIKVPVLLSQKTTLAPAYSYLAKDGGALNGVDYVLTAGTSNAAKTASQYDTIAVTIKGMAANVFDTTRHFKVVINGWDNAIIATAPPSSDTAVIEIKPRLTSASMLIDDASANQSTASKITFPVRLVNSSGTAITSRIALPYTFSTIDGSAKGGVHFAAASATAGTFPANSSTSTLSINLIQTTKYDTIRHFQVDLAPATWVTSAHDLAMGTLINGNAKPTLTLFDTSMVRPKSVTALPVRAVLSNASAIDLPLTWSTANGSAFAGTDFTGVTGGSATIRDTAYLPVSILARPGEYDTLRHFSVIAVGTDSNFAPAKLKDTALVGILPAYGAPYLLVQPTSVEEGDAGVDSLLTFTVTLVDSNKTPMTTRVGAGFTWKTQDSMTTAPLVAPFNATRLNYWTATDRAYGAYPKDFTSVSKDSATVASGAGSATFTVTIPGNNAKQADRMLSVMLTGAALARLDAAIAPIVNLGTILDNDSVSNRAYFPVAKTVVPETLAVAWVPVRIKPAALLADTIVVSVNASTTAGSENYALMTAVDSRDTLGGVGSAATSVTLYVQSGDTLLWVPVAIKHDNVRTKDMSVFLDLKVLNGFALKADPGRSQTELVIANTDPMPYLGFRDTVANVARGSSVNLPVGIRPIASDLDPSAQYTGVLRLADIASALPVWSALVSTASTGSTPSFAGRIKDASLAFATLNDGRSGPAIRAVLTLGSWNEAVQPSGAQSLYDSIVVKIDSTVHSKVAFFKDTLKVNDVDGQATIKLLLDRSSWWKTGTSVVPTATPKDVYFKTDSTVALAFAPTDSIASFILTFGNDHKVGANREFDLHLSALLNLDAGKDSILHVVILNTNLPPNVKITSPADSARLGKKDLDSAGKVLVRWSLDGKVQTPYDTALIEGWNTITKCATDEWGNVGCDSVHVTLDTTPPVVTITAISKDSGKTWIAVGPNDTPWVNKPGILVKWTSTDNGIETLHIDGETLKDSLSLVTRCIEDEVGNKGCGSRTVGLDQTPPKVWIVTPPVGSHWASSCVQSTWYEQDGAKIIRHDTTFCFSTVGPVTITVNSAPDRAGNVGTATNLIYIDPNLPGSATYVDSDGDGRIDAVVVQYPRPWTDAMPTFDISYGGPGQNTTGSSSVTYGTAGQAGTALVYNGDTIRVVTGTPVLDASGNAVVQADGTPLYQSSNGAPLLDASGKQVVNSEGIPLWKITAASTAVDSSILVVKLATPYPYGWTSSTLTDLGVMHAVVNTIDSTGKVVPVQVTETFDIKDGVAPVILESRVIRTEDYKGKDTLIVQLSEAANITKAGGTGILEISKDGGKTWIAVDVESISSTGTLKIVLEPGQDGSPSPGVLIRIAGNVTDASGNTSTSSSSPSVTVLGPQRPDLIKVTAPSTLLDVPANWGSQPVKGTFTFLTSDMDSNNLQAYKPGQGYTGNSSVSEVCPDIKLCAAFDLYVNRPSNTQLIIYDHVGTYVAKVVFTITSADLAMIKRDKLDRARLRILWNLRDEKGSQVVSGVYLVRTVIRYTDTQDVGAKFDNFVIRYGVRVK